MPKSVLVLICFSVIGCQVIPGSAPTNDQLPSHPVKWNVKELRSEERALKYVPLDQIPTGTSITKAQVVMEKAGFKCTHRSDVFGQPYLDCWLALKGGWGVNDKVWAVILYEDGKVTEVRAVEQIVAL